MLESRHRVRARRSTEVALLALLAVAAVGCAGTGPAGEAVPASPTTSAAVAAPAGDPELAAAAQELLADVGAADEPGCAVGVSQDGAVLYTGGHGVADLATGRPLDEHSTFDIASVSKQFTAAALVLLAVEGVVDLSDDIRAYVPELPDQGVTVTLEHLLHHTGGLPEYTDLLAEEFDDTDVTTTEQALEAIVDAPPSGVDPGTAFEYSNTGYFLLGLVVERATGQPYREVLSERLFDPLGMEASDVRDDADLHVDGGAEGYVVDRGGAFPDRT
ncbi:MAG TPA: serine hydrolase domain-containing protein, partial [Acidimicrobiales bacterium]|nr:serine hydrolase domain-containing protein [Acidimicrobiales bacterium]